MHPFVVAVEPAQRHRQGNIDVHTAWGPVGVPRPVVVFVHGGPLPGEVEPKPRDWPVFLGYGALAAASGVIGVTVDHRLHSVADYSVAAQDVASAVERARGLEGPLGESDEKSSIPAVYAGQRPGVASFAASE